MKITLEYLDKIGACLAAESFYKAQKTESATKLIKAALDTGREDYLAYILCDVIDSDS